MQIKRKDKMASAIVANTSRNISPGLRTFTARLIKTALAKRLFGTTSVCRKTYIKIDGSENGQVATMVMTRPPVNSFSIDFMNDFIEGLEIVESKKYRGLIITSDIPNVFCAGNDLKELLQSDKDRLVMFRRTFQNMWSRLYGSSLVTMAAIKGHAIAGGCVLSMACDVSIMATGYRIGLPELSLGLYLSPWMSGTLINAVGQNMAEKIIFMAQVFSSEKAADIGLIDSAVPSSEVILKAHEEMTRRLSIRDEPRQAVKRLLQKDLLQLLERTKEEDIEIFLSTIFNESTRKQIETRLKQLGNKK